METRIYVGNLPCDATEDDVYALFSTFGKVKSVKLMVDPVTGYSRGFGFVEMSSEENANNAIAEVRGKMFKDRHIWVSMK